MGATLWSELMQADIDAMTYLGLLQQVTGIDWSLQGANSQNQKRAMADYLITINCQPELLRYHQVVMEDHPEGLPGGAVYYDTALKVFISNTTAMYACIFNDAPSTTPFIVVQQGAYIQQPTYTIFICPAAKYLFNPQYNIYNSLQRSLLGVTYATLDRYQETSWNLGPPYSVNNFVFLDSMILGALLAIAQGRTSSTVSGQGRDTDLFGYCFKTQGAYWDDPSKSYLYTTTDVAGIVLC